MKKNNKYYLIVSVSFFLTLLFIPKSFSNESINFLSLKNNKVNLRQGPSFEYPIKLIYKKKYLPVIILDKLETWRKISDFEGDEGWIHISMISNKNTFINKKEQNLLKYKNDKIITAIIKEGVIGKIIMCEEKLCKVKIKPYRGWIEKKYLWGIKKN